MICTLGGIACLASIPIGIWVSRDVSSPPSVEKVEPLTGPSSNQSPQGVEYARKLKSGKEFVR